MSGCWGITDGSAGMQSQVYALAVGLGMQPEMKTIAVKKPFVWLPNGFYKGPLRHLLPSVARGELDPPYPDFIISCGRRAALAAMGLKTRAKQTRFIHIQDPQTDARHFDLVVAMEHDRINGPNVIKTRFALHAITPAVLADAERKFGALFAAYPKPHVAVMLGGSTNKYKFTTKAMTEVIRSLRQLLSSTQGSLLITPSRRTGEENIALLRRAFASNPRVYIYDMVSENPYLGLLAVADYFVVSNDSVNMMSEAHAIAKPLYILPLTGHNKNTKPARFAESLIRDHMAKPVGQPLTTWNFPVSHDMLRLVTAVKQRLGLA